MPLRFFWGVFFWGGVCSVNSYPQMLPKYSHFPSLRLFLCVCFSVNYDNAGHFGLFP